MYKKDKYNNIVHLLISASRMHRTLFDEALCHAGIHGSQHRMLLLISWIGESCSQKELADKLEISPASTAVTLKKLEKNELIKRRSVEADSRRNEIKITEKGMDVLKKTGADMRKANMDMLADFRDEEIEILKNYLTRINDNLKTALSKENKDRKDMTK